MLSSPNDTDFFTVFNRLERDDSNTLGTLGLVSDVRRLVLIQIMHQDIS